jgi:hypothetical protein
VLWLLLIQSVLLRTIELIEEKMASLKGFPDLCVH